MKKKGKKTHIWQSPKYVVDVRAWGPGNGSGVFILRKEGTHVRPPQHCIYTIEYSLPAIHYIKSHQKFQNSDPLNATIVSTDTSFWAVTKQLNDRESEANAPESRNIVVCVASRIKKKQPKLPTLVNSAFCTARKVVMRRNLFAASRKARGG